MAIKILHTGDLHLGAPFTFLGEKGREQRQELLTTFDKITELAIREGVNLFLIAGDLFDSNYPAYATIDRVVESLQKLEQAGISVCLIPGCHDHFGPCSIYNLYDFAEALSNLTILTGEADQRSFGEFDLTVYGRGISDRWRPKDFLRDFLPSAKTKYHVGLIHGLINSLDECQDNLNHVFGADEIAHCGMNYVALGHHHSFNNCSQDDVSAFYCGSPSMLELQKNYGHVVIVTILQSGEVDVQPRRISHSYYKKERILVEQLTTIEQLKKTIQARAHPQVFYEVELIGSCGLDMPLTQDAMADLQEELQSDFLQLTITDATHPKLDKAKTTLLPENTVLGQFVKMMTKEMAKGDSENVSIDEKALRLGFTLLTEKGTFDENSRNISEQV